LETDGSRVPRHVEPRQHRLRVEKMESGINARAIDFARFGLVFLHDGFWNGTQILPEAWVSASTTPLKPDPRTWETRRNWPDHGGYYKYHWWG
jgi:CubicO group peptidase (beta-lactamase class C family)